MKHYLVLYPLYLPKIEPLGNVITNEREKTLHYQAVFTSELETVNSALKRGDSFIFHLNSLNQVKEVISE